MSDDRGAGKFGGMRSDEEAQLDFIVASSTHPPLVLLDFRRQCDHLHLTPRQAREMAEGLIDSAKEAEVGSSILMATKMNGS
jgi:hypothetical protein